jgi:hypothetical protein
MVELLASGGSTAWEERGSKIAQQIWSTIMRRWEKNEFFTSIPKK